MLIFEGDLLSVDDAFGAEINESIEEFHGEVFHLLFGQSFS